MVEVFNSNTSLHQDSRTSRRTSDLIHESKTNQSKSAENPVSQPELEFEAFIQSEDLLTQSISLLTDSTRLKAPINIRNEMKRLAGSEESDPENDNTQVENRVYSEV